MLVTYHGVLAPAASYRHRVVTSRAAAWRACRRQRRRPAAAGTLLQRKTQ
jgi:hypothetical protein